MTNVPEPAQELVLLDQELARLDARRGQLTLRRSYVLSLLAAAPPLAPPPPAFGPPPRAFPAGPGRAPAETSGPSAQHVLLTLGGVLLTIAAVAFTLVGWGHLGITGRSAVLAAVTLLALSAPVLLLRRGLRATADAVAATALALTVLDAYGLYATSLSEVDGLRYTAGAAAVLTGLWTVYGLALGRLRGPLPAAVVAGQFPLLLGAVASDVPHLVVGWALLLTAVVDTAVALWSGPRAVRGFAATAAWVTGNAALLTGGALSVSAGTPAGAVGPGVLLLAVAAVGLFAALRPAGGAFGCAAVAGLAAIMAVGGVLRAGAPGGWSVAAYVVCAAALAAAARAASVRPAVPRPAVLGLTGAAGLVGALSVLWALPAVAVAVLGGARHLPDVWPGAPEGARAALGTYPWPAQTTAPWVLLTVGAALAVAYRTTRAGAAALCGAVAVVWAAILLLPFALDLGYGTAVTASVLLTAAVLTVTVLAPTALRHGRRGPSGLFAAASSAPSSASDNAAAAPAASAVSAPTGQGRAPGAVPDSGVPRAPAPAPSWPPVRRAPRPPRPAGASVAVTALGCALTGGVSAVTLSLATRPATVTVLGLLTLLFAGAAFAVERARRSTVPSASTPTGQQAAGLPDPVHGTARVIQAVLGCAAVVWAAGLVLAVSGAAGLPVAFSGVALLAVPASTALLGARLRLHPVVLPVEIAGACAASLAVLLTVGRAPVLALGLALAGVVAAATAVRPERRPAAGYVAAALLALASWVRLAASGVDAPEAYTLVVTAPALAVGLLRRRRDPGASSWTAYGPGLAATLLPSLVAVWADPHWVRPLLLGLAALALTLVGARSRLQAPLVLGAGVLALVALHELAPYVVQVVGALPRWLPPAAAGLLLLAVGATYERRLRDARRLRASLGRMG